MTANGALPLEARGPRAGLADAPRTGAGSGRRKGDDEAAAARSGESLDFAVRTSGESAGKSEPESRAARALPRSLLTAYTRVEDVFALLVGDADAVIVDRVADHPVGTVD